MNENQILIVGLILLACWIYYQSQQPKLVSKGTQTEEKETKEVGTQWEYQFSSSTSSAKEQSDKNDVKKAAEKLLKGLLGKHYKPLLSNPPLEEKLKINEISSSESSVDRERERERANKPTSQGNS